MAGVDGNRRGTAEQLAGWAVRYRPDAADLALARAALADTVGAALATVG